MNNHKDDKWFADLQQQLQQFETEPPALAWDAINQKMKAGEAAKISTSIPSAVKLWTGLALVICAGFIAWWFANNHADKEKVTKVQTEEKITHPIFENKVLPQIKSAPSSGIIQSKREVTVSAKNTTVTVGALDAKTDNEINNNLSTELPKSHTPVATTMPDTASKVVKKSTNFYERMRQDSTLKKQQLFK